MELALEGLKVIDVSQGIPGPFCAMQMGDLGAEVIKVEPPDGDWLRQIGPFVKDQSAIFLQLNRNKKGIVLNLKRTGAKGVLQRLVKDADVFIEGYRPEVMERLGFGYEALAKENPRLVYCSISAYGSQGSFAQYPGTELAVQSLVGANRHLGVEGESPLRMGADLASANAAFAAFQGIMAALFWRERSGQGQKVETSILSALITISQWFISAETNPDKWVGKSVTAPKDPPDYGYRAKDMPVLFSFMREDDSWAKFCNAIGKEELAKDPRFATRISRSENESVLKKELNAALANWSLEDLKKLARELEATIVPMHNYETLFNDPQIKELGVVQEMEHPTVGRFKTLNIPWVFHGPSGSLRLPPPLLGQHTEEVLQALGYTPPQIKRLA